MALNLLPLALVPKQAGRDGQAGENAHILLPGIPGEGGYFYFDGKRLAFPNSTVVQNPAHTISGVAKNLPFHKAAGVCITPA